MSGRGHAEDMTTGFVTRAVVVYESMFGNTRLVAEAIGGGLASAAEVAVVPVNKATADVLEGADLVVVGGPTHIHGMSRARSRQMAATMARKPSNALTLEPGAEVPGWDQDAVAAVRRYDALSVPVGLRAFREAVDAWVWAAREAPPAAMVRHPVLGELTTGDSILRNAHEAVHHELDVRRGLGLE